MERQQVGDQGNDNNDTDTPMAVGLAALGREASLPRRRTLSHSLTQVKPI
jgi:hypothetical protein